MEAAEYEIMYRVEETHWWYKALHRLLFSQLETFVPKWKQSKILDAGCGTGAILQKLGNPDSSIGVDLSPDAIRFCQARDLTNVRLGDITKMEFQEGTFDAVVCSSVLYHRWVADVGGALTELRRVLRDDGYLFVNLPAFDFLHSPHDEAVFTARRFTRPAVRKLLKHHGFEVRYMSYWTTLLFPLAWAARYARLSKKGRDFENSEGIGNTILDKLMRIELGLAKKFPLPFGVALFCVAQKSVVQEPSARFEAPAAWSGQSTR